MDDPNVIAYLFAVDGVYGNIAEKVIRKKENEQYLLVAKQHPSDPTSRAEALDRSGREATEPPEQRERNTIQRIGPCLVFRLDEPPKTRKGIVFGRSPDADVVLLHKSGISRYHFALAFDDTNRLVVRDLGSSNGTRMLYESVSEHAEPGFNVHFSAEGPDLLKGQPTMIKILDNLVFGLVVAQQDISSHTYLANVERFREGSAGTAQLLADMELLSSASTALQTPAPGTLTANSKASQPKKWTKEIGRGAFAVVYYAWDVQTREAFALKKPISEHQGIADHPDVDDKRRKKKNNASNLNLKAWRREAKILQGLRHPNIVQLKHYIISDDEKSLEQPELYFEFVPNGSLADRVREATTFQQEQATYQILLALAHLHGQLPEPIVHRDVKPENVLVQTWGPRHVHVKLADFGLSKEGNLLQTFCGTLLYLAPEGYTNQTNQKYGPLVDIWSLGALVFRLVGGVWPKYRSRYRTQNTAWARALVDAAHGSMVQHPDNDLLAFAIDYMLVPDHSMRRNVWHCLDRALQLRSVAQTEYATLSGADRSPTDSDDLDGPHKSDMSTPKALQMMEQQQHHHSKASEASRFQDLLGEWDDEAIDNLIGMAPSGLSSFERRFFEAPKVESGDDERKTGERAEGQMSSLAKQQAEEKDVQDLRDAGPHPFNDVHASVSIVAGTQSATQHKRQYWDDDDEGEIVEAKCKSQVEEIGIPGQVGMRRPAKKGRS